MANDPQIERIIRELTGLTEKVVKKITLDVTANLIEVTPVDTGWARANWVPAIGRPYSPNDVNISPEAVPGASRAQQQGIVTVVTQYTLAQGNVFVSNNVPYITMLNDGHSQKEPAGFVQRSIEKAITIDLRRLS